MSFSAENRRKYERFAIHVPAILEVPAQKKRIQIHTQNISAGGGLFKATEPLEKGSKVKIEMVIKNETITKLTGTHFKLKVKGTIVRLDRNGFAVSYGSHKMLPMKDMLSQ